MSDIAIKAAVVIICAGIGLGATYFGPYKGRPDNPIEEKCEEVIKDETGVDIDLTPGSPETEFFDMNSTTGTDENKKPAEPENEANLPEIKD